MLYQPGKEVTETAHKLPHWQQEHAWLFVTYRLADSLPKQLISGLLDHREAWLHHNPKPWNERQEEEFYRLFGKQFDEWLDKGHGSCCLKNEAFSEIVANAFLHFDEERYLLDSFVVMPNHVHVLFSPFKDENLPDIIKSWKWFTAREINKLKNQTGQLWQPEYWDTVIRHQEHFHWARNYIEQNPENLLPKTYHLYQRPQA